jgi:hypothetical protein
VSSESWLDGSCLLLVTAVACSMFRTSCRRSACEALNHQLRIKHSLAALQSLQKYSKTKKKGRERSVKLCENCASSPSLSPSPRGARIYTADLPRRAPRLTSLACHATRRHRPPIPSSTWLLAWLHRLELGELVFGTCNGHRRSRCRIIEVEVWWYCVANWRPRSRGDHGG